MVRLARAAFLVAALAALPGAPAPARAQALDPAVSDGLRTTIRRLLDSAHVVSVAVAVARDGAVLWEEGFGYADVARRVPATPATLYSIASISKPMTATAVMTLVQAGRVDLDRPIDDYLGASRVTGLAGDRAGATVRRVLSHTAGLPLHYRFFYAGDTARPNVALTIARYGRVMFPPGEVYSYSNLGFGMLGEVVRHVSGVPYEAYMRDHVFRPLGMATTTIGTGAGIAGSAVRYDAEQRPIPYYDFDHRGASAVYTSAHELARFGMFHLKTRPRDATARWAPPLTDASIDAMQHVTTPGDTAAGYGLGWAIAARRAAPPPPPPAFAAPGLWTLLDDATYRGGLLGGRFVGTVPTADARRVPHVVAMSLALRDGTMRGWAAAQATGETNDYALSSYAELTRTGETAGRGAP